MFLGGLACCGVSMLFAYLTQLRRLNDIAENTNTKPSWRLSVALVFFILGLVLFISGAWLAVTGFE
jgi:NADH:ubiquinone oxidoreductase subunit 2 (subunit N)